MKAICDDGLVIDCAGYKAIDSGVVLTADEDRDHVVGFVPNERLEYLLPDDVAERERDRLGLSAPTVTSAEDLEARLDEFADELEDLREHLDRHVEELIGEEDSLDEEDLEQQDELHERRRAANRLLQQVRQRSQQFRQLSPAGAGPESEGDSSAGARTKGNREDPTDGDVETLRAEMDDRFDRIERQLEELAGAARTGDEDSGTGTEEVAEADDENEGSPGSELERVDGLGSTYRSRLADAGIETLRDLAERSPEEVAAAADAPESRAASWVEPAEELAEERDQEREDEATA
jgi:predicted flap endonuclease-1-like 5' DNA nuclease